MERQYKTRQRETILNFFKEHKEDCYSIKELVEALKDRSFAVGEATAYRTVDLLCKQKLLKRFAPAGTKSATYQYLSPESACLHHFHLKCQTCGKLIHADCEEITKLAEHMKTEHGFFVNHADTVFYGECAECREKRA